MEWGHSKAIVRKSRDNVKFEERDTVETICISRVLRRAHILDLPYKANICVIVKKNLEK